MGFWGEFSQVLGGTLYCSLRFIKKLRDYLGIFPNNKPKTFVLLVSTPTSHPLYHCRIATSGQSEPPGKSASKVAMMALILQWSFVPVTHIHVLSLRCWFYCIHCRLSTLLYPPCNKFLTQHSDFSMSTTTWSESSSLVWSHSCRLGRGHYTNSVWRYPKF